MDKISCSMGTIRAALSGEAILATLTLEDLVSNGLTVDLNITFDDDAACGASFLKCSALQKRVIV